MSFRSLFHQSHCCCFTATQPKLNGNDGNNSKKKTHPFMFCKLQPIQKIKFYKRFKKGKFAGTMLKTEKIKQKKNNNK